jgi:RNA polymerase sporulation-specific sigma factor
MPKHYKYLDDINNKKSLTNKQNNELLKLYAKGNMDAREELLVGNLRLVQLVAWRFYNKDSTSYEELCEVGVMGLIKAVDNFNLNLGTSFSTYAVPMIAGELRRYFRDYVHHYVGISREMWSLGFKALRIKEKLTRETNLTPNIDMISEELKAPRNKVEEALNAIKGPFSLDYPYCNQNSGDTVNLKEITKSDKDSYESSEFFMDISRIINKLTPLEKRIFILYYYYDMTQKQISIETKASQVTVSRRLTKVLNILRNHL